VGSNKEVKKTFKDWSTGMAADFYDAGIQKLKRDYAEKCFQVCSDVKYSLLQSIPLILIIKLSSLCG
jgi:hypothetical protein